MPCKFNVKPEDRHCQYCTATICDERQPKPIETFTNSMTDKVELKSCHEVIDTVDVVNIESIFCGKPTDPDILTVVMKDGKRLYCDEVCPVDSLQEEPVSEFLNIESMIESYKQRLISQANGVKNSPLISMCLTSYKHGINETLDTLNLPIL